MKTNEELLQKSTEELLDIWVKNDRNEYSREGFVAIHATLSERGEPIPLQSDFFVKPKSSKIFLKFLALLTLILVVLAFTNPSKTSYIAWSKNKVMEQSTGLQAGIMSVFAESMIASSTITKDYRLCSTFTTTLEDRQVTVLGIFNQFIVINSK